MAQLMLNTKHRLTQIPTDAPSMKKIISTIIATLVAMSFSSVVFAADATPAAPADATHAAVTEKTTTGSGLLLCFDS